MTATDAHARRSDPIPSHLTLQSLGRDTTAKARIVLAAFQLEERHNGRPWNDTQLLERIEQITRKRWQRNVIARTRGLMEHSDDDPDRPVWVERVGVFEFEGRLLTHYKLTEEARLAR